MDLEEIKNRIENVEIKETEEGRIAEIYVWQSIYIYVYENDYSVELHKASTFICILTGIESVEDLELLIKLMTG